MLLSRLDPRHTAAASQNARNATNAALGPHGNKRSSTRHAAMAEVNGMEMGEVTVIESAPEATVKAVEVPPPPDSDVQGTPNPVRAEGEMI